MTSGESKVNEKSAEKGNQSRFLFYLYKPTEIKES